MAQLCMVACLMVAHVKLDIGAWLLQARRHLTTPAFARVAQSVAAVNTIMAAWEIIMELAHPAQAYLAQMGTTVSDAAAPTLEPLHPAQRTVAPAYILLAALGPTMELARHVRASAPPVTIVSAAVALRRGFPRPARLPAFLDSTIAAVVHSPAEYSRLAQAILISLLLLTVWAAAAPIQGQARFAQRTVQQANILLAALGPATELALLVPGLAQAIH